MEIVFMGTGTSHGVPMIAHESPGLDLEDRRNWRTRTSAHVELDGFHVQIDAAPEFRLQCIHNRIARIDAFVLTHGHADHIMGMDDLRRFVDLRGGKAMPVYSTEEGLERVRATFPYAMRERPEFKGYPAFAAQRMPTELELPGGTVWATLLPHGRFEVLGLVFRERSSGKRLAYYTDCKRVPEAARELARGADVVVLDALRQAEHPTHMNIAEAIETAQAIGGRETYFTHMTWNVDHARDSAGLPEGVRFAHDGLRVRV